VIKKLPYSRRDNAEEDAAFHEEKKENPQKTPEEAHESAAVSYSVFKVFL